MMGEPFREVFQYRALLWNLVRRDLVVRYKRSVLGIFWTMLHPIINTAVYTLIFSTVFRFQIKDYGVYFLSGFLIWNFFAQTTSIAPRCLLANVSLFNRIYVPKAIFVVSALLSGLINFSITIVPLLVLLPLLGSGWHPSLLFLPLALLFAVTFTLGISLLLASTSVVFHDIGEMYGVLLTPWMFLTPVIYPVDIVPDKFISLLHMNPWLFLLKCFREPIYLGQLPELSAVVIAGTVSVSVLLVGCLVFRGLSDKIIYYA